jgi:hypothetical protein
MWLQLKSKLTVRGAIAYAYTPLILAQQITNNTRLPRRLMLDPRFLLLAGY